MTTENDWTAALGEAVQVLSGVLFNAQEGRIQTPEEHLAAAVAVEKAARIIEPTAVGPDEEPIPGAATQLVRDARRALAGHRPVTWAQVARAFELKTAQRAHDRFAPNKANRLLATRQRVQSYREPAPHRDLPGLSAAEACAELGIARTALRNWAEKSIVHAWPLMDDEGKPVAVLRNGKPTQSLRYYLHGVSAAEAAATLGSSEWAIVTMGERGEIGRSMVLDPKTHEPLTDKTGTPRWQYFPEHISSANN